MVSHYGANILTDDMKTPDVLHILEVEYETVRARQELEQRKSQGPLDSEQVYQLVLAATRMKDIAEKASAEYVLRSSKKA